MKCELDALKIDNTELRKINDVLKLENEKLKNKLKSAKRSSNEKVDSNQEILNEIVNQILTKQILQNSIIEKDEKIENFKKINEEKENLINKLNKEYAELNDKYYKLQIAFIEISERKFPRRQTHESINMDTNNGLNLESLIDDIGTEQETPMIEENTVNMKLNIVKILKPNPNQNINPAQQKSSKAASLIINNDVISKYKSK